MSTLLEQAIAVLNKNTPNAFDQRIDEDIENLFEDLDEIDDAYTKWENGGYTIKDSENKYPNHRDELEGSPRDPIKNAHDSGISTGQKQGAIIAAGAATAVAGAAAGIRGLYRKAHGVTHEQVKACNGSQDCIHKAYADGANKKASILQQAKAKDPKNAAKYDAKIAKLKDHAAKY